MTVTSGHAYRGSSAATTPRRPGHRARPRFAEWSVGARHLVITSGTVVVLVLLTFQLAPYRNYQLATVAAYLCATAGLTVLIGLSGQISLGHGALMATGAYTVALLQGSAGPSGIASFLGDWVLLLSVVGGVVVTTVVGAVVGVVAARLRGPYLAGVTLAVTMVVPAVTTMADGVFHGDQGLSVYVSPPAGPVERWQAWVGIAAAAVTLFVLANLVRSRYGREFRAVRDDEVAAQLAGVHVTRTRVLAFVVSAACAGLGGAVFAVLAQSVSPSAFSLTLSLFLLMAVVIGGLGSLAGAAWGALLIVLLPDAIHGFTDGLQISPDVVQRLAGNLPLAVFGLTLVVVVLAVPGGLHALVVRTVRRMVPWAALGRAARRVRARPGKLR
jgi:branched-chain amino acid transport system permease protein